MTGRENPTYNWSCQRKPKQWNSTNIYEYNSGKQEILAWYMYLAQGMFLFLHNVFPGWSLHICLIFQYLDSHSPQFCETSHNTQPDF